MSSPSPVRSFGCFFLPPHVLDHVARAARGEVRDSARVSVAQSRSLREDRVGRTRSGERDSLAAVPPPPVAPRRSRARKAAAKKAGAKKAGAKKAGATKAGATAGGKRSVYDSKHTWAQQVPPVVRAEGGAASADADVNHVYDFAGEVRAFFADVLGRDSIDNHGMALVLNVHYGKHFMNAFWDGSQMTFGDGDGAVFSSFAASLDVVAHELTHGVTQFTCALEYHDQPGALNEHLSDVFGSVIQQRSLGQDAGSADWLIGDEIMGPDLAGEALRSMRAPGTAYDNSLLGTDPQPAHMRHYFQGKADNGGVHINSGIPNRAFYLVATTVGTDKAALIWYQGQQLLWPTAQFADAKAVLVEAARTLGAAGLVPKGSPQAVRAAFRSVGV
jgi:Zn-dependent metalloprotease